MQLSTRGRYAVMALADLASRQAEECCCGPVCLAEIAGRQQLSLSYLEQLFGKLRRAGLVSSARGPGGGYKLARPCEAIAIGEIVAAVDEPISATRCEQGGPGCLGADRPGAVGERCQTHDLWAELSHQIEVFLMSVTLGDVINGTVRGRAMPSPSRRTDPPLTPVGPMPAEPIRHVPAEPVGQGAAEFGGQVAAEPLGHVAAE